MALTVTSYAIWIWCKRTQKGEVQEPKVSWSVAVENLVIKKLHKIHCILVFTSLRSPEVSDITAESGVIRGT